MDVGGSGATVSARFFLSGNSQKREPPQLIILGGICPDKQLRLGTHTSTSDISVDFLKEEKISALVSRQFDVRELVW
jgi:hypothetical protein